MADTEIAPITAVLLEGFKAHRDAVRVKLAPLTVLCGANSSGKSSVMQALLLLKQTVDSTVDRGDLRLDGPHVSFDGYDDMAWHARAKKASRANRVKLGVDVGQVMTQGVFKRGEDGRVAL